MKMRKECDLKLSKCRLWINKHCEREKRLSEEKSDDGGIGAGLRDPGVGAGLSEEAEMGTVVGQQLQVRPRLRLRLPQQVEMTAEKP